MTRHDLFKSNHWQGEEPNGSPEELRRVWLLLVKNLENVKEATESSVNIEKGTSADGEGSKSHTSATYTFCPTETYNAVFRTGAKSQVRANLVAIIAEVNRLTMPSRTVARPSDSVHRTAGHHFRYIRSGSALRYLHKAQKINAPDAD